MADDVTRGIQDLLYPRLAEFEQRLDRLDTWHKDLKDLITLKEDRTHTNQFQEQVEGRFKHVDGELQIERKRHERFEELRTEQMRELRAALDTKTEREHTDALVSRFQAVNLSVAQKADSARAEQLANQLHMLSDDAALKAKIDQETAQQLHEKMKTLKDLVMDRATNARAEDFARQFRALSKDISMKAEIARVEDMRMEVQHVREEVGRAISNAAGLGMQLHALGHALALKSDQASVDQAVTQLGALKQSVARKVEPVQHRKVGEEQVARTYLDERLAAVEKRLQDGIDTEKTDRQSDVRSCREQASQDRSALEAQGASHAAFKTAVDSNDASCRESLEREARIQQSKDLEERLTRERTAESEKREQLAANLELERKDGEARVDKLAEQFAADLQVERGVRESTLDRIKVQAETALAREEEERKAQDADIMKQIDKKLKDAVAHREDLNQQTEALKGSRAADVSKQAPQAPSPARQSPTPRSHLPPIG